MGATASSFCPWEAEARLDVYLLNIRDAAAPGPKGLLSPLLQRYQAGTVGLEIFGLPAVQAVIRHKWLTFAKTLLMFNIACFLLWLSAFTTFMVIYTVRPLLIAYYTVRPLLMDGRRSCCRAQQSWYSTSAPHINPLSNAPATVHSLPLIRMRMPLPR